MQRCKASFWVLVVAGLVMAAGLGGCEEEGEAPPLEPPAVDLTGRWLSQNASCVPNTGPPFWLAPGFLTIVQTGNSLVAIDEEDGVRYDGLISGVRMELRASFAGFGVFCTEVVRCTVLHANEAVCVDETFCTDGVTATCSGQLFRLR